MHKLTKLIINLPLLFLSSATFAGIAVTPVIVNFMPGKPPREDVMVANVGTHNAYVEVTPALIEHPGTKQEKRAVIHNPAKLGILVTPNRFIIPPKQRRDVRIILTKPEGNTDRIYRVRIAPVSGQLISTDKAAKGDKLGVHLVIAYGVLATVRPKQLHPNLQVKRKNKTLTISNLGNTNVLVVKGEQCNKQGKACQKIPPHRMYAGNVWKVKLKYTTPVSIKTDFLNQFKTIESN